ncbi:MAG: response regulator [Chloroherpetonaceae bacterium]|nr:response regulator [Chloroherpetonaceae bacterium]
MPESHILLVDDEPMVLSSLSRLLEDDYTVHTADGGAKAIELAKKYPIKVVISDQRMPGMLGHEVLRQIKAISPNTIRMLLTGYSDLDAIISSVNAGEIFRYINKPWKADNLCNLVKLGIQIYDKITLLQNQETQKPSSGVPLGVQRSVHIEVEEKSGSVLFVDYGPNEAKNLADKFSKGFDVTSATSVDEAFKELAKRPISVVVSNVNFGDIDGISFLNTIRQEYPNVITVILTEVKDATLAVRSINELGVFKYLVKPTADNVIEQTIKDAAQRSKSYQSTPTQNVRQAAETIAPDLVTPKIEESALRLRLRAAQALLSKTNLRSEL